jgi:hypothetical protein
MDVRDSCVRLYVMRVGGARVCVRVRVCTRSKRARWLEQSTLHPTDFVSDVYEIYQSSLRFLKMYRTNASEL